MTNFAAKYRHKLTGDQLLILDFLERRTPSRYAHNLHSVKVIAAAVGCTARTVRNAFERLRERGLIARLTGAALRALRNLWGWRPGIRSATALLWRAPGAPLARAGRPPGAPLARPSPPSYAPGEAEKPAAREAEKPAAAATIPPDPPNRRELKKDEGLSPSPSSGPPGRGGEKGPEEERPPAPPELLQAAAAAFGAGLVIEAKVREAAAVYPASWVARAVAIAAAKLKPWAYARGILGNFAVEGGPEPELPAVVAKREATERAEAELRVWQARAAAGPPPDLPPDEAEVATLREWAANPRQFGHKHAVARLRKHGIPLVAPEAG